MTSSRIVPDPFHSAPPIAWDGGPGFAGLVEAMRAVQDLVGSTNPPADVIADATTRLTELAGVLRPWLTDEENLIAGRRHDLPGRGHPLLLPFEYDVRTDVLVRGRVRYTPYYLGGNGAAHGGSVPLLFDEVLGMLSNGGGRTRARTAFLHVNYRRITPVGPELTLEATFDREEGRKRYVSGRLYDGGELVADAEGLFVTLRAGQP